MYVNYNFTVERSVEEVFNYFANVENILEWATFIRSERFTTDGGVQQGAEFKEDARIFGIPIKTTWTVTIYEPYERFVFHTNFYMATIDCTYQFESQNMHTHVSWEYRGELHGLWKLITPIYERFMLSLRQREFPNARRILEARSST